MSRAQLLDELQEAVHRRFGLRAQRAVRRRNAPPRPTSEVLAALACSRTTSSDLRADAARRQVHDALERRIVGVVRDDAQVGQRILDFRALEEPQAAVHLVRNARRHEDFFEHARLRVLAVEDRHVAPRAALVHPVADAVHDELGFVALVERGVQLDALAVRCRRSRGSCRGARCCWRSARSRP